MSDDPLDAIRKRDEETAKMWFTGPASFTAQAARDRRLLLDEVESLRARLAHAGLLAAGETVVYSRWNRR